VLGPYRDFKNHEDQGWLTCKVPTCEVPKHLLCRRAVTAHGHVEVRLSAWCLVTQGKFHKRTCGFVHGIPAGNQRVAPAHRFERSSDREVNGPCRGRGSASGGIRDNFKFVCRQQTKGERREVGIICGIKEI
jgi:hypothetical protein